MSDSAVLSAGRLPEGSAGRGGHHPSVERVLDRLLTDYPAHFPDAAAPPRLVSLRVAARRLSDVARAELQVGSRRDAVYIKIHKHHRSSPERVLAKAELEFTTLSHLHPRMRAIPRCGVARPIAFFPEERAVVTAEVGGENLYQTIKAGVRRWSAPATRRRLATWCEESGVWLRHFQEITAQGTSAPVPADTLLAHFDRLLARGPSPSPPATPPG